MIIVKCTVTVKCVSETAKTCAQNLIFYRLEININWGVSHIARKKRYNTYRYITYCWLSKHEITVLVVCQA